MDGEPLFHYKCELTFKLDTAATTTCVQRVSIAHCIESQSALSPKTKREGKHTHTRSTPAKNVSARMYCITLPINPVRRISF